eukprot:1159958-Pelagomonas_calceolata.AAC.4
MPPRKQAKRAWWGKAEKTGYLLCKYKFTLLIATFPGHGRATEHKPELVLNNFGTRIGRRVGRMFASLFAQVGTALLPCSLGLPVPKRALRLCLVAGGSLFAQVGTAPCFLCLVAGGSLFAQKGTVPLPCSWGLPVRSGRHHAVCLIAGGS